MQKFFGASFLFFLFMSLQGSFIFAQKTTHNTILNSPNSGSATKVKNFKGQYYQIAPFANYFALNSLKGQSFASSEKLYLKAGPVNRRRFEVISNTLYSQKTQCFKKGDTLKVAFIKKYDALVEEEKNTPSFKYPTPCKLNFQLTKLEVKNGPQCWCIRNSDLLNSKAIVSADKIKQKTSTKKVSLVDTETIQYKLGPQVSASGKTLKRADSSITKIDSNKKYTMQKIGEVKDKKGNKSYHVRLFNESGKQIRPNEVYGIKASEFPSHAAKGSLPYDKTKRYYNPNALTAAPAVDKTITPNVKKLIDTAIAGTKKNRNSARKVIGTKASSKSLGRCGMYVEIALNDAGLTNAYNLPAYHAFDLCKDLKKQGFTAIPIKSLKSLYDLPPGAVLVYSGGAHGHTEIRTQNGFVSDYLSPRPRTGASGSKSGRGRTLKCAYIKR